VVPELSSADVRPGAFSPNGDGCSDTAKVRYVPAERCSIRVAILDADGKVRRRLTDWRSQSKAAHSATWDGKVTSDGTLVVAAEGEYRFSIECRDAAGNTSRKGVKVALDRTLGFSIAAAHRTPSPHSVRGTVDSDRHRSHLPWRISAAAQPSAPARIGSPTRRRDSGVHLGLAVHLKP